MSIRRVAIVMSLAASGMLGSSACASRVNEPAPLVQPHRPRGLPPDQYGAEDLYKDQRFAEAAWVFAEMLAGRLPANVSVQRAEFWLGKSLYQLGDYPRSLEVFSAIARVEDHEYRLLTLAWLATLTRKLPEPAIRAMLDYPIAAIDDDAFVDIRDHLAYLYGAWHVQHLDHELGVRLLDQVPPSSDYRSLARFELAESSWRANDQRAALALHREVVEHWVTEQQIVKRLRRKPPPEHVEISIQRLRSGGFDVESICGRACR